jgi:hypothetical protein
MKGIKTLNICNFKINVSCLWWLAGGVLRQLVHHCHMTWMVKVKAAVIHQKLSKV